MHISAHRWIALTYFKIYFIDFNLYIIKCTHFTCPIWRVLSMCVPLKPPTTVGIQNALTPPPPRFPPTDFSSSTIGISYKVATELLLVIESHIPTSRIWYKGNHKISPPPVSAYFTQNDVFVILHLYDSDWFLNDKPTLHS